MIISIHDFETFFCFNILMLFTLVPVLVIIFEASSLPRSAAVPLPNSAPATAIPGRCLRSSFGIEKVIETSELRMRCALTVLVHAPPALTELPPPRAGKACS